MFKVMIDDVNRTELLCCTRIRVVSKGKHETFDEQLKKYADDAQLTDEQRDNITVILDLSLYPSGTAIKLLKLGQTADIDDNFLDTGDAPEVDQEIKSEEE